MCQDLKGSEFRPWFEMFAPNGRGQIIFRDPDTGVLVGGTDSRTDSQIACY